MSSRFPIFVTVLATAIALSACGRPAGSGDKTSQAVLTVETSAPLTRDVATAIETAGVLAPWQEVSIGPEVSGYRISDIAVDVGTVVSKGQVLARLDETLLRADVDQRAAA
jgi:HlyD family secretion protein